MSKQLRKTSATFILVVFSVLLLVSAFICLSIYQSKQLDRAQKQVYAILQDSASDQISLFNAVIDGQFGVLDAITQSIDFSGEIDYQSTAKNLDRLAGGTLFKRIFLVDKEGNAYSNDGLEVNVASRSYFSRSLIGERNIERVDNGLLSGITMVVISTPIKVDGEINGVIYASYEENQFVQLLGSKVFGTEGYSFIIEPDGDVVIASKSSSHDSKIYNVIDQLNSAVITGEKSLDALKSDMLSGKAGVFAYEIDGESRYSAYSPMGVSDWIIFDVVSGSAVDEVIVATANGGYLLIALITGLCLIMLAVVVITERIRSRDFEKTARQAILSEERYRLAIDNTSITIWEFDFATHSIIHSDNSVFQRGFGPIVSDVPESIINSGFVHKDYAESLREFYAKLYSGEPNVEGIFLVQTKDHEGWWYEQVRYRSLFDKNGKPYRAIGMGSDVTREVELRRAYEKEYNHQQSMLDDVTSYALFDLNTGVQVRHCSQLTSENSIYENLSLEEFCKEHARRIIDNEDAKKIFNSQTYDQLSKRYHNAENEYDLEYKYLFTDGSIAWVRYSAHLMLDPSTNHLMAFLYLQNIDDAKKAEEARLRALITDQLTGLSNLNSFVDKVDKVFSQANSSARHALLVVDVDKFKRVNLAFGRTVGDELLKKFADQLSSLMRSGDILGRVGGDEFAILLTDVPYDALIEKQAQQINTILRRTLDDDVCLSASIGIALFPSDGQNAEKLIENAQDAVGEVKNNGNDGYAFFGKSSKTANEKIFAPRKKSLLVVDDEQINRLMLEEIFKNDFDVMLADSGEKAISMLRYYGVGISVVLLDIMMKGVDGFEVLRVVRSNPELESIPVIVVSATDESKTGLKAIEMGATDFLTKPIDSTLIQLRVKSAISKAENEQLRIQNSYLKLQSDEEARYRMVLESTGTAVIEYDVARNVFVYDKSINKYISGNYNGRNLFDALMEDEVADKSDIDTLKSVIFGLVANEKEQEARLDILLATPKKAKRWFSAQIFKRGGGNSLQQRLLITLTDVTDEIQANFLLRERAERDPLTKLYNRETFMQKVAERVKNSKANDYALIYFDIDRFKSINELFGHAEGDKFLCEVAQRLIDAIGDKGLFCRISADNFAVCAPYETHALRHALLVDCKGYLDRYNQFFSVSASFGIYLINNPDLPVETMLDYAVIAQKTIKGGYNLTYAYFDETMYTKELLEREYVGIMKQALQSEQFEVYYQPQYNHSTCEMIGAEALIRWNYPNRGLISPVVFVPIFERNGFITEIDKFVLKKVCEYLQNRINSHKLVVPISVNLSRVSLYRTNICQEIKEIFDSYEIPTYLINFEITESAFTKETNKMEEIVLTLQGYGFKVEMDDFGSGYSSLNALNDITVDVLKLDMRFLTGKDDKGRSGNILMSVIRMAKWLNMSVIAEGVENRTQADYLESIGCSLIQGYLYAKPMPKEEFNILLDSQMLNPILPKIETLESFDLSTFQDPTSLDTLVFSNFLGASCVFEYCNGSIEILRANKDYIATLGLDESRFSEYQTTLFSTMDDENLIKYITMLDSAVESFGVAEALTMRRLDKNSGIATWIKSRVRVIARSDNRYVLYGNIENVTQREVALRSLDSQVRSQEAVLKCIRLLYGGKYDESAMKEVLRIICEFYGAVGCSLRVKKDNEGVVATLCSYTVSPKIEYFENVKVELSQSPVINGAFEKIGKVDTVFQKDMMDSPYEYKKWIEGNIDNVTYIALNLADGRKGMLSVYSASANRTEHTLLETVAYYIAGTIFGGGVEHF